MLADGYSDVPLGKVAAVVTHLEMFERPPLRADPSGPWQLRRVSSPDLDWFRALFRSVGVPWLWSSRLKLSDAALSAIIRAPGVEVYAVDSEGRDQGLLELDFCKSKSCEIAFFGLAPSLVGRGAGRWLMNRALERAWAADVSRVWLHTCTFDHPAALAFYQRSGFRPFRRQVEVVDDPRSLGLLPPTAAPHIPFIVPTA